MKQAIITPTKYVEEFGSQGDFILALSHLMDSESINEYEKAIYDTKLPIILDNGLFENHEPEGIHSLLEKAICLNATHFFAPDKLYDREGTRKELTRAINLVKRLRLQKRIKIAAVVQADNQIDYIEQLFDFNKDPGVDLIGLSILSVPKSFGLPITKSRIALMKEMIKLENVGVVWKDCHLLGLGDSYEDVLFAAEHCPWIVSNDTSCCFQSGSKLKRLNKQLEVPGGKVKEKVDFNQQSLTKMERGDIQHNIDISKKIIKKVYDNRS